jgi:hypothetical protein
MVCPCSSFGQLCVTVCFGASEEHLRFAVNSVSQALAVLRCTSFAMNAPFSSV